ncbi:MAG: LytTR family DNA-binding domain-containing protein [Rhodobacterales bacterium]|nr:LytTR family DNA-binding domain-containing protein [Rhodobacterales bacterium]
MFRDFLRSLTTPVTLTIWVLVSVTSAITGPFGTYANMEVFARSVYWTAVAAVAIIVGNGARFLAAYLIGTKKPAAVDALSTVLTVLAFTPILWGMTMQIPALDMADVPHAWRILFYVLLITALVVLLRRVIVGADGKTFYEARLEDIAGLGKPAYVAPRLAKRFEQGTTGPILRLTVSDHLVEVIGERATETLRMRFADAIDEMDPVVGYCTHRSHWVTRDAIRGVVYEPGGKVFLDLQNGDKIPVSRKYRPALENFGII